MLHPTLFKESVKRASEYLIKAKINIRNTLDAYFYLRRNYDDKIPILNYEVVEKAFEEYKKEVLRKIREMSYSEKKD